MFFICVNNGIPIFPPKKQLYPASFSDVKIAPLCTSFTISGLSGLQLGDLKIKSNPCKFSRLFSPVYKLKLHSFIFLIISVYILAYLCFVLAPVRLSL